MMQDLRFALRTLVKSPVPFAAAVLCLALGIGVNTTIFSVVDGVLIQALPFTDPDRLVVVNSTHHQTGIRRGGLSYPDLRDLQSRVRSVASWGAVQYRSLTLSDREEAARYSGAAVSWSLFPTVGLQPALGRGFGEEDDRPGAAPVVILSHEVWRTRYRGDPDVVGTTVLVNATPHTVIGVMPEGVHFPFNQRVWVPLTPLVHESSRDDRAISDAFARMRPEVSPELFRNELETAAAELAGRYPTENAGWGATLRPAVDYFIPDEVRLVILTMMGAVTLVLLIACANVASLLLARATVRHREIALRAALGAGRLRIVRQMVTESLVLSACSVPLGLLVALTGVRLLDRAIPADDIPYLIHWTIDARVVAYSALVAALTAVLFGLAPAMEAARANLVDALKEGGRGGGGTGRRSRLRHALVVGEVALALVLLVGASLFMRSFDNLQRADVGFDPAPLMTMRFYMAGDAYARDEDKVARVDDILRRIEALPGVQAAFASNLVPLQGGGDLGRIVVEGRPVPDSEAPLVGFTAVTPGLFDTLGVPLRRGRGPTIADDRLRRRVAVVNELLAHRLWGDEDPVGSRFRLTRDADDAWFTVIGIVADFHHQEVGDEDAIYPSAYVPYGFGPTPNTGLTIRVAGDPAQITSAIRAQIRESDPTLPLFGIATMEEVRLEGIWQFQLFGRMFGAFGLIAIVLATVGVYGVLSYAVTQRVHEIGVRVTLGALRADVMRLIIGQGMRLAVVGVLFGLVGAAAVTRVVASLLYNVSPLDPLSFALVTVFLLVTAAAASVLPARRALNVDPMIALRSE